MRILIENGLVLKAETSGVVCRREDIVVEGERISQIGRGLRTQGVHSFEKTIDASRYLIIPGLVNAHFHSYDAYFRGLVENLPLDIWSLYVDLARRKPYSQHEIYVRTAVVASEMLHNGITTAHDNVTIVPLTSESVDTVMQAYADSGLRAVVATTVKDKPLRDSLSSVTQDEAAALVESPPAGLSEILDQCTAMIGRWQGKEGRLHVGLAPSAPQRCSDELLLAIDDLSMRFQVPITTHVLETKAQAVTGRALYGKGIVEHLSDLGMLSRRLSIHHGVWLTDREIDLLAEYGTSVVHNPVANLKLGSGIAPLRKMLEAGVNVALGCDNVTDNDSLNLFEVMKLAALLPEVSGPSFGDWEPANQVFRMATTMGARSVLLEDDIGSLAVGKRADMVLLDLDSHPFTPFNEPVRQLVYCEMGQSVDTVLVNGCIVVEDKQLLTMDEQQLMREARSIARSREEENGRVAENVERVRRVVERIYWRNVSEDIGLDRYSV